MPLGDSITRGTNDVNYPNNGDIPGGYRKNLGSALAAWGHPYDFVGARSDNAASGMDPQHYGINGIRTDEVLATLNAYLEFQPHNVLMMLGTNDVLQGIPVPTIANNLNSLISQITANAPKRRLYVATILPITGKDWNGQTAAALNANANAYNTQVRNLVQQHAAAGLRVTLVDFNALIVYTDPNNSSNNFFQPGDGVHPGQAGYNQMANIWFNAITATGSLLDPPPAAPTQVGAAAVSSSRIDLHWTDASNDETGFKIERMIGQSGGFSVITTVPAGFTSYSDTGLTPNTAYTYRLLATGDVGNSSYSNTATATSLTAYDSWSAKYPAFLQLPADQRAASADPNGDGISNLLAYALAIDPLSNTGLASLPRLTQSSQTVTFQFRHNILAPDLVYQVLVSPDLKVGSWTVFSQAGATVQNLGGDGSVEQITVTIPKDPANPHLFVRLSVTKN